MPIRPVLTLPHPLLIRPARDVGRVDAEVRALAGDLVDTMLASPACVGLAAPQIGVDRRAFALDVSSHKKTTVHHGLVVMFDPVVVSATEPVTMREGCMSVPDFTGDVSRASRLVVSGTGRDGETLVVETEGFEARAFLHEIDHLDGRVFLDRVAGPHAVFRRKVYRPPGPTSDDHIG